MNNKKNNFVLLVHFRDPFTHLGGAESVIRSHCEIFQKKGYEVYILFPVYKQLSLKRNKITLRAWALLKEKKLTLLSHARQMQTKIAALNKNGTCCGVFIHSLIFSNLDELHAILSFRKSQILYLHDYSSCCAQYTLMKNGEDYCGDARLYDKKCDSCKYYNEGKRLKSSVDRFLSQIPCLYVVSPSENLANNWGQAFPQYANNVQIIGHKRCNGEYLENRNPLHGDEKIRVAFVGKAIKVKGFEIWKDAVDLISKENDNFSFFHFGFAPVPDENIDFVPVSIVKDGLNAMTNALRSQKIHIAFLFSIIPETYSLTYYECMSANCFIVTSELSGNIKDEVKRRHNGVVLPPTRDAVVDFLHNHHEMMAALNEFRQNGLIGPECLTENDDFIMLLKDEVVDDFANVDIPIIDVLKAKLVNVLYRIRYRQF